MVIECPILAIKYKLQTQESEACGTGSVIDIVPELILYTDSVVSMHIPKELRKKKYRDCHTNQQPQDKYLFDDGEFLQTRR